MSDGTQHEESGISRRTLLLGGATALGAAAVSSGCATPRNEPLESYPVVPENRVKLPPHGRSVILIGAGLSGLITAAELIDRGFKVTVLEKNASAGGRVRSWREKAFGQTPDDPHWRGHPIEHGTHLLFNFYNNFREFMGRHGITGRPGNINGEAGGMTFAYGDGSVHRINASQVPAPFHAMPFIKDVSPRVPASEAASIGMRQALALMSFDAYNPGDVRYLDSISVSDWMGAMGFPASYVASFMDPLWDMGNFLPSDQTSALILHRLVSASCGHWKDLFFHQFLRDSTNESIIDPIHRYVVDNGGEVLFNQEVVAFDTHEGRITGVHTRDIHNEWICPVCGEVHEHATGRCRRCSHLFTEPTSAQGRTYQADEYLLGVDIPVAKKMFAQPPFNTLPFFASTQELPTSSIVVVYLWYPRVAGQPGVKSNWDDHFGKLECYMTAGFKYLGTTLNWRYKKHESFKDFDADIIETQIARTAWTKGLDNATIAMKIHEDLKGLIPGLPDMLDSMVVRWDNFTACTVGSERHRPEMFTPLSNFLILGDWNALDHNCFLMEKVNVNARKAVNHLLDKYKIAGGKMTILPSETPNLALDAVRKMHSVKAPV